jgi:hypothetical protein
MNLAESIKDCKSSWEQRLRFIILVVFFLDLLTISLRLKLDDSLLSVEPLKHRFEQLIPVAARMISTC